LTSMMSSHITLGNTLCCLLTSQTIYPNTVEKWLLILKTSRPRARETFQRLNHRHPFHARTPLSTCPKARTQTFPESAYRRSLHLDLDLACRGVNQCAQVRRALKTSSVASVYPCRSPVPHKLLPLLAKILAGVHQRCLVLAGRGSIPSKQVRKRSIRLRMTEATRPSKLDLTLISLAQAFDFSSDCSSELYIM